ncbi:MAG: Transcription elongation factor GreA [Candidatus Anoxychlamydiales bacterium]|nr:Transcription elongation factor GreA [Candidatus Anoxychlamydiales bacterium]
MSYLTDLEKQITKEDYQGFLKIFEEYCFSDEINPEELIEILILSKNSSLKIQFGAHVIRALTLLDKISNKKQKHEVLKLIVDIQNKNDEDLANLIYHHLKEYYPNDKNFNEKIKLIGLRTDGDFQGSISKYELLSHINKGKFVYHKAGWGTGEILDVSHLREEMTLEFEYVIGQRNLSFSNALKTLIPLDDNHFLSRRFGNPDLLEKQAKENPIKIIHLLLKDLGPKTAAEIKDHLCELVIPEDEWNKWWQQVRSKIKKDTLIQKPKKFSKPFSLREKEISYEELLHKDLEANPSPKEIIEMVYSFLRDYPQTLKNEEFKGTLTGKLLDVLSYEDLLIEQKLQLYYLLEFLKFNKESEIKNIISSYPSIKELLEKISIVAFKKRTLIEVKKYLENFEDIYIEIFFRVDQNVLREYILTELIKASNKVEGKIKELLNNPILYPHCFIWYFQKLLTKNFKELPYFDEKGINLFFESFMILLDHLLNKIEYRDLAKKMINLITQKRYQLIRDRFSNASIEEVKEYLLLATKCGLLEDHDIKIIHSLASVVYPVLASKDLEEEPEEVIFITQESYQKLKEKLEYISSVEMIENSKEIEEARSHGDLRENAEYKAALEKRNRIQQEIKYLSEKFNQAKILNKNDIITSKANVGCIIKCKSSKKELTFTILGPFEADADKNILSFQSKLAKIIIGKSIGEKFDFQDDEFTLIDIRSYFD